jgi:hypothetical protein
LERGLEALRLDVETLKISPQESRTSPDPIAKPQPAPLEPELPISGTTMERQPAKPEPERLLTDIEFPLPKAQSVDGIIAHLTRRYRGHVHEKEIVTITSKSVYDSDVANRSLKHVAELNDRTEFWSMDEPGQWVCWDFRERRVRPTYYTMDARWLKSWIVESSVDGETWTVIDRRVDTAFFASWWNKVTFEVEPVVQCRFIRITDTDKNHRHISTAPNGDDVLALGAVEFFGTLSE